VPLFVPILVHLLGLVFGLIQAYVFSVLALVYIASATSVQQHNHHVLKSGE
jgi:F-type H+-transporting ATPase subunit a